MHVSHGCGAFYLQTVESWYMMLVVIWFLQVLIYSPDGRCLFKYLAHESGLGVKSVSWSPCGQFLAVGSYDQMLRVLNQLTWKVFAEFMHLNVVRAPCCAATFKVFKHLICHKL